MALLKKKTEVTPAATSPSEALQGIILRPCVTEKATHLTAHDTHVFLVHPTATRVAVKAAVRAIYGVQPLAVRVLRTHGKKMQFKRVRGERAEAKKAFVKLPKGTKMDVHSGV